MNSVKEMRCRVTEEEFNVMYASHYKQVFYSAYTITKDPDLAKDVTQETFLKAYRYYDVLQEHAKKVAWLKAISRNMAIDFYRKKKCRREFPEEYAIWHAGPDEADRYMKVEFLGELLSAIEPSHRQALLLVYEYGLTYDELASYLQL